MRRGKSLSLPCSGNVCMCVYVYDIFMFCTLIKDCMSIFVSIFSSYIFFMCLCMDVMNLCMYVCIYVPRVFTLMRVDVYLRIEYCSYNKFSINIFIYF